MYINEDYISLGTFGLPQSAFALPQSAFALIWLSTFTYFVDYLAIKVRVGHLERSSSSELLVSFKTDSLQEVTVSISEGCYWVICAWLENLGFATQLDTVKYKSSCDMQLPEVTAAWVWTSYHNYHHLSSSIIIHHKNHCHMELCMCCKSS